MGGVSEKETVSCGVCGVHADLDRPDSGCMDHQRVRNPSPASSPGRHPEGRRVAP
jgi:hypothetical protein